MGSGGGQGSCFPRKRGIGDRRAGGTCSCGGAGGASPGRRGRSWACEILERAPGHAGVWEQSIRAGKALGSRFLDHGLKQCF